MRPDRQQSIEECLCARRDDIEQAERERSALDLARERMRQWCIDGGYVHTDLLDELLADIDGVTS